MSFSKSLRQIAAIAMTALVTVSQLSAQSDSYSTQAKGSHSFDTVEIRADKSSTRQDTVTIEGKKIL
ncbi:MAG: hypothetical protein GY930_17565 [bacterium]|nr:hypothetical protein [bacterium]